MLVNQTPTVLEADIYAVAALAAGAVVAIRYKLHYPPFVVLSVGALLCVWLRVMAIYRGWHLPVAQSAEQAGLNHRLLRGEGHCFLAVVFMVAGGGFEPLTFGLTSHCYWQPLLDS